MNSQIVLEKLDEMVEEMDLLKDRFIRAGTEIEVALQELGDFSSSILAVKSFIESVEKANPEEQRYMELMRRMEILEGHAPPPYDPPPGMFQVHSDPYHADVGRELATHSTACTKVTFSKDAVEEEINRPDFEPPEKDDAGI